MYSGAESFATRRSLAGAVTDASVMWGSFATPAKRGPRLQVTSAPGGAEAHPRQHGIAREPFVTFSSPNADVLSGVSPSCQLEALQIFDCLELGDGDAQEPRRASGRVRERATCPDDISGESLYRPGHSQLASPRWPPDFCTPPGPIGPSLLVMGWR